MMRSGSDWMKKQSLNSPGVRYPETGVNPDVNRGEFPIYPEGQVDSTYRQPPGVGVSNIINNLVTSVGASGKNVAAELQRIMKLNTAQTNPNVIQDKLYGDTSNPVMDTQAKTPSEPPAYSYTIPSPYNPDVKIDIDAEDYNMIDDGESTGGMNEPMDLSDFPDKKATTSKPAGDYVKDKNGYTRVIGVYYDISEMVPRSGPNESAWLLVNGLWTHPRAGTLHSNTGYHLVTESGTFFTQDVLMRDFTEVGANRIQETYPFTASFLNGKQ
jgi:hypothetical protein